VSGCLAWGIGIPADLFDGYMCTNVGVYDEKLIDIIRERFDSRKTTPQCASMICIVLTADCL
jgi:hypothetical protein